MNTGTPSHRDRDELLRLVADSLPLLVCISGPSAGSKRLGAAT
jgi:hypothetical protein